MNPVLLTNKTFVQLLIQVLAAHGLPWVIGVCLLAFICTITYQVLKRKGIIGTPPAPKLDLTPMLKELGNINSTLKSNGKLLDLLLEHQSGYLTEEQARYVLDSFIDTLITGILSKVMETYTANNVVKYETAIKQSLCSEMETLIRDFHRESDMIPNIMKYTKPIKEQIKIVSAIVDRIVDVMKDEKVEREAARKCKSIISTSIKNNCII